MLFINTCCVFVNGREAFAFSRPTECIKVEVGFGGVHIIFSLSLSVFPSFAARTLFPFFSFCFLVAFCRNRLCCAWMSLNERKTCYDSRALPCLSGFRWSGWQASNWLLSTPFGALARPLKHQSIMTTSTCSPAE